MQINLPFIKARPFSLNGDRATSYHLELLLSRLLFLIVFCPVFLEQPLHAMDVSGGFGIVDEGDDRSRPAALLRVGINNDWQGHLYLWGRSYGPVSETSVVMAAARQGAIFGSKSLMASVGLTALAERTSIVYKDAPAENSSYTSTNFGLMLGLNYELYATSTLHFDATWDAHIYPAGSAAILLVTARKQIVGLSAGIVF